MLSSILIDLGRIGLGMVFVFSLLIDTHMRKPIFDMMHDKKVPVPWLFYRGAMAWKAITGIALIFNLYTFWAALLLALYIFIANVIFYNFWAVAKEQYDFTLALFIIHIAVCCGLLVVAGVVA